MTEAMLHPDGRATGCPITGCQLSNSKPEHRRLQPCWISEVMHNQGYYRWTITGYAVGEQPHVVHSIMP